MHQLSIFDFTLIELNLFHEMFCNVTVNRKNDVIYTILLT